MAASTFSLTDSDEQSLSRALTCYLALGGIGAGARIASAIAMIDENHPDPDPATDHVNGLIGLSMLLSIIGTLLAYTILHAPHVRGLLEYGEVETWYTRLQNGNWRLRRLLAIWLVVPDAMLIAASIVKWLYGKYVSGHTSYTYAVIGTIILAGAALSFVLPIVPRASVDQLSRKLRGGVRHTFKTLKAVRRTFKLACLTFKEVWLSSKPTPNEQDEGIELQDLEAAGKPSAAKGKGKQRDEGSTYQSSNWGKKDWIIGIGKGVKSAQAADRASAFIPVSPPQYMGQTPKVGESSKSNAA